MISQEIIVFVSKNIDKYTDKEFVEILKTQFDIQDITKRRLRLILKRNNIKRCIVKGKPKRVFPDGFKEWFCENSSMKSQVLIELSYELWGVELKSIDMVYYYRKKWDCLSANNGRFVKGRQASNKKPSDSEAFYYNELYVKLDNGKWIPKRRYMYEQYHNVKLKKSDRVIFLDGDKNNFSIENLYLANHRELSTYTSRKDFDKTMDPDITKAQYLVTKLEINIKDKTKEK